MSELDEQERFVWFGFLLLAGDCAHEGRICATENSGYTDIQLADLLKTNPELIKKAKKKFLKFEKIEIEPDGIIVILKWHLYQSEYLRQKSYRVKLQTEVTDSSLSLSPSNLIPESELDNSFEKFWEAYPKEGRLAKKESRIKFGAICKQGEMMQLSAGLEGYVNFLKHQRLDKNFDQRPMYAKTFLNGRWTEFVGFKYEPSL
jgi:uncharacterized short protein YbdD (DUF466 family)